MPELYVKNKSPHLMVIDDPKGGEITSVDGQDIEIFQITSDQFYNIKPQLRNLVSSPEFDVQILDRIEDQDDIGLPPEPGSGTKVEHEQLTPKPDGQTQKFYLDKEPIPDTVNVYVNQLRQPRKGPLSSYDRDGREITFEIAPKYKDYLTASYEHDSF